MPVTKITIGRLFNLGSYEHVRYEISVDVKPKESAAKVITSLERILEALAPNKSKVDQSEIDRSERRINEMLSERNKLGDDEFKRRHGFFEGTPLEYIARCAKSLEEEKEKRESYKERHAKARKLLDDLGGEATWKDAKLDWEDNNDL